MKKPLITIGAVAGLLVGLISYTWNNQSGMIEAQTRLDNTRDEQQTVDITSLKGDVTNLSEIADLKAKVITDALDAQTKLVDKQFVNIDVRLGRLEDKIDIINSKLSK